MCQLLVFLDYGGGSAVAASVITYNCMDVRLFCLALGRSASALHTVRLNRDQVMISGVLGRLVYLGLQQLLGGPRLQSALR